jgi:catechol 2,3-dioxygenase-like lactoylglutathione lyase family enzyme
MIRTLAFLCGLLIAAVQAHAEPVVDAVSRIVIPVSDLDRATKFYTTALTFEADEGGAASGVIMRLGAETIELVRSGGRKLPADWRSNDHWFQHLAIVVSDIDRAYAQVLHAGATAISAGPQTLPAWNPNADGIRAVYFRDPEGHPLELIQFPPGKGEPRWQATDLLFLGIDHAAIATGDTESSLAFYRDRLGLQIAGTSENWGIEQERLSGVEGAHVRITTLRAQRGPGIEFLQYLMPGDGRPMPADTRPDDLWAEQILMIGEHLDGPGERLRDPDGHIVRIVTPNEERLP